MSVAISKLAARPVKIHILAHAVAPSTGRNASKVNISTPLFILYRLSLYLPATNMQARTWSEHGYLPVPCNMCSATDMPTAGHVCAALTHADVPLCIHTHAYVHHPFEHLPSCLLPVTIPGASMLLLMHLSCVCMFCFLGHPNAASMCQFQCILLTAALGP